MIYVYMKEPAMGITDIYIDAAEIGSIDGYDPAPSQSQMYIVTGINVASSGLKDIKLLIDGKHASATNFRGACQAIMFWRSA